MSQFSRGDSCKVVCVLGCLCKNSHHSCFENLAETARTVFLTGAPLTVAIVQIPSRFQVVDGVSALEAGIRVLPFSVLVPIGASITASVAGKTKIPPIYLSFCGSALQVVGFALLSTLPLNTNDNKAQYGYQAIAGFAIGINLGCLTLMAPAVVEKRDKGLTAPNLSIVFIADI